MSDNLLGCDYVYVVSDGRISKIGMSSAPWRRRWYSPRPGKNRSRLVCYWHLPDEANDIELTVKHALRHRRYYTGSFEWFRLSAKALIAEVEKVVSARTSRSGLASRTTRSISGSRAE